MKFTKKHPLLLFLLVVVCSAFSTVAYAQPTITLSNGSPTVCSGTTSADITYSATTGAPVDYSIDWDATANGQGFVDVVNAALPASPISTAVPAAPAAGTYNGTLTVRDAGTTSSIGYAVSVTVNAAPVVTDNGVNRTICEGTNTTFSITATGSSLTYQWQASTDGGTTYGNVANGGIYSGATTATLTLTAVPASSSSTLFRCVVSSASCPDATSAARLLVVNASPTIAYHGVNQTVCSGDNTNFTIVASAAANTFQWEASTNGGATYNNVTNGGVYSGATTATLTITGATSAISSTLYRCVASGPCGSATSGARLLVVNELPSVSTQPTDKTICAGSNTTFDVIGSGANVTYQWQVSTDGGATFNNLTNVGIYSNVTTQSLGITAATVAENNNQYRCVVSGTCPPSVNSAARTLTVNGVPTITVQPVAAAVCNGDNGSFSVTATGTGITYQWQESINGGATYSNLNNGGIYSGVTTATLNLTGVNTGLNNYQYRCVVSGTCTPAATSNSVALTINESPVVTDHGVNRTICDGDNTTFSVTATGAGLTYQWEASTNGGATYNNVTNGGIYSGATTATLTLTGVPAASSSTLFRCVVSGTCTPAVNSAARLLVVNTVPSIAVQAVDRTICAGGNTTFEVVGSGAGITYQWELSTNGGATWNNVTNGGIYTGAATNILTITAATAAENNNQYRCVVSGTCTPAATSTARTLTVNESPVVTVQPANTTVCQNATANFTVTATGAALTYQWQESTDGGATFNNITNGGIYSGATTNSLSLSSPPTSANNNQYRCVVSGTCTPAATSNAATLTVDGLPVVTDHGVNRTICDGDNTTFAITATGAGLTYQWEFSTNGGATYANVTNGGIYSGATTATLTLTGATAAVSSTLYRCVVSGTCAPGTTSGARLLTVTTLPSVAVQPANKTICEGGNTTFDVVGSGAGITYQWQLSTDAGATWNNVTNGGIYSNATTQSLGITAATAAENGNQYRCVISGTCPPAATSNAATLTVNVAPVVTTQPANSAICPGGNTSFTIVSTGATLSYQWQESTDGGATWNNLTNTGIYSNVTTATLNLTGVTVAANNNQYRCVVNASCTPSTTSNAATLTFNSVPAVTSNGVNSSICAGDNTSFTITATGTGLTYQWEASTDGGTTYNNVTNGGIYSGATTATLTLTAVPASSSSTLFRCVVSGTCTPSATSAARLLTVTTLPSVTVQPVDRTICAGNNTTFDVVGSGAGITYQWQLSTDAGATWNNVVNGGIYSNATTQNLGITAATAAENGNQYRCVITGTCPPAATSAARTLTVETAPAITAQPANTAICPAANASFSVTATGASLTYQWQESTDGGATWNNIVNGGIYSNATTATLNLTGVSAAAHNNQYRVVINGNCTPAATSNAATLTINTLPAITAQPANSTICEGTNTSFSVTATGTGLTYQWQVSTNAGATWTNLANAGIYSNVTTATLNLTAATAAENNNQYRCIVGGTCPPSVTSNAATLTIDTAPAVTAQPANSTICEGNNTSFSVTATGTALTYQWQLSTDGGATWNNVVNGGIYSNATTATLNLTAATAAVNNNQYRCVVSGTCTPAATSNAATLTIDTAPVVTAHPANSTICPGANTSFSVTATGTALTYQWQVSTDGGATWNNVTNGGIYSNATTATLNLTAATVAENNNQYRCAVSGTCTPATTSNAATLTFNSTPAVTAQPMNSTICEGTNTSFSVTATGLGITYQWQLSTDGGATWNNVVNGGIYSNATTATLNLTAATAAENNNQYRCVVSGTCTPPATSNAATLTINTSPVITVQPANSTICDGANTSFSVTATGTALTYQWQVSTDAGATWNNVTNGGIYSNATTATLNLTAATTAEDGNLYRCAVSGTCTPAVNSTARLLTVNSLPNITAQPMNSTICEGNNTLFSITATGTGISYQWQLSTDAGATWNNVTNGGIYSNATTATLNLTAATAAVHNNQYRCVVSGTCTPAATSNAATLTIDTAPAIVNHGVNRTICEGDNTTFDVTVTGTGLTYQWQASTDGGTTYNNVVNGGIYSNATTASLTITSAIPSASSTLFRCVIGGTCPPGVTSAARLLVVNATPKVAAQPADLAVCLGDNASFTIIGSGAGVTYQWQESTDGGATWNNVVNGGAYSGATTQSLGIATPPATYSGNRYRCVVSGTCTPAATSNVAQLTVNTLPAITGQPSNTATCPGGNASYTVTATGSSLSYQWYISSDAGATWGSIANGGIYSGATTATLSLTGAAVSDDGNLYRCVVSGVCLPNVTSNTVSLSINTLPAVTVNPMNSTICEGSNTSFTAAGTGTGVAYQWQVSTDGGATWNNLTNTGIYTGVTTTTLNLTAASTAVHNNQYRCMVSGTCTPAVATTAATLTIDTKPVVTVQPMNSTICEGTNTSFSVTATGTALTYQWQLSTDGGATWNNVVNGGIYSNATTATLNLTAATVAVHNNQYRCVVSGTCAPSATSNAATLTINTSPVVTVNPVNSTICEGSNTSFSVTATGTALTYQWQVSTDAGATWNNVTNGGIYTNATTATLNLTAASTAVHNNQYRCVVSGTCTPSATSTAATLTIDTKPVVTVQPINSTICDGNNTTFSVTATGTALTYQWQVSTNAGATWANVVNGGIYSNATTATLNITAATTAANNNQYRCIVSGTCAPSATSNAATLTVNSLPAVTANPMNSTICEGSNTSFTAAGTGTGVAYQWQVSTDGGATWNNVVNGGIYTNATTATLNLTAASTAVHNNQYRCAVSGTCTPAVTTTAATLTIDTKPVVTVQPANSVVICAVNNASFSVTATGTAIGYQWQESTDGGATWNNVVNGGMYSNATTATLNLTNVPPTANNYQYRCVVSGTCAPSATSNAGTLTVNTSPFITNHGVNRTICEGDNTTFDVAATGAAITYQWQASTDGGTTYNNVVNGGIYSNATTASLTITNATATASSTLFRCVLGGSCPPGVTSAPRLLVVNVRPAINVQPVDRVICDGGSTTFDVNTSGTALTFQWQVSTNGGGTWTNVTNTGIYSDATTPSLNITAATTAVNNYQYRCVVSGACTPSVTTTARTLTVHTLPAITANPTNKSVCDGSNTTFSVTTTGTGISYQWQVSTNSGTTWANLSNAGIYGGTTTATLSLTGASLALNGYQYRCMVNSVCAPSVTSTAATLTMLTLPGFTAQPVNSVVCLGDNASFSVSAIGTAVTYQWQVSTNGGGTWNNVSNGGVYSNATTATLNLNSPAASFNNNQYRCIISGTCTPSVTSMARTLTVNTPPAVTSHPNNSAICDGNSTSFSCSATGTGITYQWQANTGSGFTNITNGSSGAGGFTYSGATASTLSITNANLGLNNAQYRCVVSGASPCTPATTNSATLIVYPILQPALTITASDTDICVNTSVTFTVTSTTNPGPSPSFQWKRNGTNVGGNSTSYTTSSLANGDVITCVMTSSVPCPSPASVTSNTKTMIVHPRPVPSITISGPPGDSVCDTRPATFTVTSTVNGGANPVYQWQINGVNTGVATTTFTTNTLVNGDVVSCRLTSSALCATPMVVSSAGINMKVTPLTFATGRIQATPGTTLCEGDTVNVFCYYTNGGPTPTFDWYINGNLVANNPFASLQSSTLKDGDTVHCIFTNSFSCPEPVITNKEIFTVNKVQASSVSISANPSVLVPGMSTTFTANPVNGGANPTYTWRKSGQVIPGVTGDTYVTNDLVYLDKIQVTMKPDHACKVNEFETSNTLVVTQPNSIKTTANGANELGLYPNPNNGEFTVKGTFAGVNGETKIAIYNNLGQKVHTATTDVVNGELKHKLNLNGTIAPGLYTLSIEVDGQVYTRRFNIVE